MKRKYFFKILYFVWLALLVVIADNLVGYLIAPHPPFLNSNDEYLSNPRSYWKQSKRNSSGQTVFFVDRSQENLRLTPQNQPLLPLDKPLVMAIGDSFVYGQGVHLNDTFVHQYAEKRGWSSLNGGISGADITTIAESAKKWIPQYKPQLVIYGYVLNDTVVEGPVATTALEATSSPVTGESPLVWDFINHRTQHFYSQRNPWLHRLSQKSHIVDRVLQFFELRRVSQNTIQHYQQIHSLKSNTNGLNKTVKLISDLKILTEANSGKFLVIIFPIFYDFKNYHFLEAHKTLSDLLTAQQIENLDLFPYFKNQDESQLWVHPSDQHPNEIAHRQVADILKSRAK